MQRAQGRGTLFRIGKVKEQEAGPPAPSVLNEEQEMNVRNAYWAMVILTAIPMPLLLLGWFSPSASWHSAEKLLLTAATCSYVWLILAMKFPMFLAEPYSGGRFAIINTNFLVMLICSIATFRGNQRRKGVSGLVCILITVMWGVLGAINVAA